MNLENLRSRNFDEEKFRKGVAEFEAKYGKRKPDAPAEPDGDPPEQKTVAESTTNSDPPEDPPPTGNCSRVPNEE